MKTITNYQPGPRGINLKGGTTRWVEPGETIEIDEAEVAGKLPDFGKPADQGERDADEVETLRARVADLEAELASYRAGKGDEPGPLDQSVAKLSEYLKTVDDADEVQKLIDAETAGKSRDGAIAALEARRDAILGA